MALKNCIQKMNKAGMPVSSIDQATLQQFIDDGLSDDQAIRKLYISANKNVIDIASRAREQGAPLTPVEDPVTKLQTFQAAGMQKLLDKSEALNAEKSDLIEEESDITTVEEHFARKLPAGEIGLAENDINNDQVMIDLMLQFSWEDKDFRTGKEVFGLKGKDQFELLKSFRGLQAKRPVIQERITEINTELKRLEEQASVLFHGVPKQKFYQSEVVEGIAAIPGITFIGVDGAEIVGAVIPADTTADDRALLLKRGILHKEYQAGKADDTAKLLIEQMKDPSINRRMLFQDRTRASIDFDANNRAIIRMTEAKDLSSFLHESAHMYLEMMADLAEMEGASVGLIDDYTKALNYLGVNSRDEITSEHHELWARSFEAYLREGVAPTAELQDLFTTYKGWLIRVYRELKRLLGADEQLSDEIRGVFDRLVATEDAISQAENSMQYVQLYQNAEEMGVSPEAFDVYRREMQQSHQEAVDHESKKMIKAMQWAQQQWWNDELKKIAAEVQAEAEKMQVYEMLFILQRGTLPNGEPTQMVPFKLSGAQLKERFGPAFMKRLPKPWVYSAKGGIDLDIAADVFRYDSAKAMVEAIIKAPKMADYVKAESNRRMQENHPDPLNSPEMIDDAMLAVHNEKRGRMLAAELRALRKAQRRDVKIVKATKAAVKREEKEALAANRGQLPGRASRAVIKAAAVQFIAGKKIRDINPNVYRQAEQKAGRLAFVAMEKKDYAEAYRQKLIQINNFEAYRAAVQAKQRSLATQKYLKRFENKRTRARMGKAGVLDEIEAILENISFKTISMVQMDRDTAMKSLDAMVEEGRLIVTPETLAKIKDPSVNWRDLTFEELEGIREVIKQLEHKAVKDLKAIINGEEIIIQEQIDEVATSIIVNQTEKEIGFGDETLGETAKRGGREGIGHWLRPSSIARILDKAGFGAVTRRIILPIRRAYVDKLIPRQEQAAEAVAALYQKHYTNKELAGLSRKIEGKILGKDLSRSSLLALALNWGTESNRAAVLGGIAKDKYGKKSQAYTEQGVAHALSLLDSRDWAFVQDVWDFQESFWGELAETEKRRRGVAPKKVESLPFIIRAVDGEEVSLRGGYHHLQYDSRHSRKVSQEEFNEFYQKMNTSGYLAASTRSGATFERARNHGKVVRLSLNVIDQNVREILRDITIGDEVNLVHRILESEEVDNAARNTGRIEFLKELKLWLTDAAVGELPAQSIIEKTLAYGRVGFTKSKLAFNVYVTALQLTGIFQSMAVIGKIAYARGFGLFLKDPIGNYEAVMKKSKFMEARYGILQTWDKDVSDTNAFLKSVFGAVPTRFVQAFDKAGHLYFYPIAKFQSFVDVTTWMGAYEKGLNDEQLSEADAILYADSQVEASQTSGLFSDRSGIERGTLGSRTRQSQFVRLWTTLISYMLAKGNIAYEKGSKTNFRDPKQVVEFATDLTLLYMVEGIASALLYGHEPGEDDADETLLGWTAKVTAESVTSGIPLVREINAARYGSGNTPVGALAVDLFKFKEQVEQGEADEAAIKAWVKVQGTLLHLPASQVNRAVEAFFADDPEWYEYLTGTKD